MLEHEKPTDPRDRRRRPLGAAALSSLTAEAGSGYRLSGSGAPGDAPVLEGRFLIQDIGLPLQVHASDALEVESARASILLPPSLTVSLILHGDVDATLDGRPLGLSARRGPAGRLWCHREPARLERGIRAGQRVRKINLTVPLDAVESLCRADDDSVAGRRLLEWLGEPGLTLLRWTPSPQAIRFAEQMLSVESRDDVLGRMTLGACALTVVREALAHVAGPDGGAPVEPPAGRDAQRAYEARSCILERLDTSLQLTDIAARTAMSVSTLQRVFKNCFGITVNEFIRVRRLERARTALCAGDVTVSQAAWGAGYSNAANFATAFRREFGYPPSHCLRNGGATA